MNSAFSCSVELALDVEDVHPRAACAERPTSKSLKSCAGVIFTAPVPFSGSEYSSATIGMAPADQRQDRVPADQVLVAFVVRMHRDGGVTEHRFGPGRGNDNVFSPNAFDRILDVPQRALHLDLLHLEIGDGGKQLRVPVNEPLVLVDQVLPVELDEDLQHGLREPLVHGEALARPVARSAEPLELLGDGAAGLGLPGPDLLEEFLAADLAAVRLLPLHHLPLDHHLRRDAGVIGAGLPEHVASAHPLEAAEDVLQRVVERVAHVQ